MGVTAQASSSTAIDRCINVKLNTSRVDAMAPHKDAFETGEGALLNLHQLPALKMASGLDGHA